MHESLRARLLRNLEALPDEQVYQVLDYVEFLGSKYNRSAAGPGAFQRFSDRLEDKMRLQGLGWGAIKGTMTVMGTATRVVTGITEAGRTVFREVEQVVLGPAEPENGAPPPPPALRQGDGDPQAPPAAPPPQGT
jgi:hypothetical protein